MSRDATEGTDWGKVMPVVNDRYKQEDREPTSWSTSGVQTRTSLGILLMF